MMNIKKIVLVVVLGLGTVSNLWAMHSERSSSSDGEGRESARERSQDPRNEIPRLTQASEEIFHSKVELLHGLLQEYAVAGAPEIGKILATLTQQEKKLVELAKKQAASRVAIMAQQKAAQAYDVATAKANAIDREKQRAKKDTKF